MTAIPHPGAKSLSLHEVALFYALHVSLSVHVALPTRLLCELCMIWQHTLMKKVDLQTYIAVSTDSKSVSVHGLYKLVVPGSLFMWLPSCSSSGVSVASSCVLNLLHLGQDPAE